MTEPQQIVKVGSNKKIGDKQELNPSENCANHGDTITGILAEPIRD